MKLSEEQLKQVEQALLEKGIDLICKECGTKGAVIVDEIIVYKQASGGIMPAIMTGCSNCGRTTSFMANRLVPGLVPHGSLKN
ncbi:hypothetical protein QOZ98_000515 [Planomicrobium stackebrandtii]|uniref:HNH endonuclease n=1 Tax=Planomicrobium stackebrandtii TaxID=253160 RepID=A0ABU0GSX0_9BACL|nr:hypothetical protein [Planomicrobium stackebrandtii]MDQ0427690.1 hypothetical protein [Planomicrobium stackebrandtii]